MRSWPATLTLADFAGTFKVIRHDGTIDLAADAQGLSIEPEGSKAKITFFHTTAAGVGPPEGEHTGELAGHQITGRGFAIKPHGAIDGKKKVLVVDTSRDPNPRPFQDWEAGEG